MKETIKAGAEYLALSMEAIAGLIIAIGAIRALYNYIRHKAAPPRESMRWSFLQTLIFALEFLLAADILLTAVAPSWNEIGQLGAIAAIRIALNYFLTREMKDIEKQEKKDLSALKEDEH